MKIKNILILYKTSVYRHSLAGNSELHKLLRYDANLLDRFIKTHEAHYKTLQNVEDFLRAEKLSYSKVLRGEQKNFGIYDFVITVGGDGTFLEGASRVKNQLILGINSNPEWSVGRFCYANPDNFAEMIKRVILGKAKITEFNRLQVDFCGIRKSVRAVNDILICHSNPAAMSRYFLQFRGEKEEQRSSGVWVSTAAGSTGAIRSANGKVLPEKSKALQFVVREPYCGKRGTPRKQTAVFSPPHKLGLISLMKDGMVFIDGSHIQMPFPLGEQIVIHNSPNPLRVVVK